MRILDPTEGSEAAVGRLARRPSTLEGKRLGVVDNQKRNARTFLTHAVRALEARYALQDVVWLEKGNHSAPITESELDRLRSCDAVLAGVGD